MPKCTQKCQQNFFFGSSDCLLYYPHNLNCTLTLAAEKTSEKIMFYFKYIDIRAEQNCEIDWLGIYDGDSVQSPTVCGIIGLYLSRVMRKPTFCICENKDADQLRGNREADQRLCFRYLASTISLLPKYKILSL